ncbi:MAG TPA: type I glyceraldehyde-3-phosphate dehydrogenase [Vitreimonas sp.]|nr:type I glyceraldehyde-3-phosphate dehydrogenase [Vitreimonas sp.]
MNDTLKIFGINGFGRIGRTAFRVWWHKHAHELDLKVINTSGSMDIEDWVHLLKYDSNYGIFDADLSYHKERTTKEVSDENPVLGSLIVRDGSRGERKILITAQRDPAKIPWGSNGVETVIDSTGVFITQEKASLHLQGGAKTVVISAPPKGGNIETGIIGVNQFSHDVTVVSNASCTTNCVAPVASIVHHVFGVKKAMMTTVHSYTDDQNLHDNSHKDMRRARAAAQNIVPTSTGAAISVTEIIPELKGMFDGLAIRVPTAVGSLSDMVFVTARPTSIEEVNKILIEASQQEQWRGVLAVTDEAIVSSDIKGRPESSIVDLSLTNVIGGDLVKIVSWYDNEFGYCNRLIEQVVRV